MKVCIAGAGPAGLSLGCWLKHYGFEPTILEKAPEIRKGGYMIDFFGTGYEVADRMGLIPQLKKRHFPFKELHFLDNEGKKVSYIPLGDMKRALDERVFNFPRGSLVEVLLQKAHEKQVPIRTNTHIQKVLKNEPGQPVQILLSDGSVEEYDVLVGCDGIHSHLRQTLFQPDHEVEYQLGYQCGSFTIPKSDTEFCIGSYSEPGKTFMTYPLTETETTFFYMFESDSTEFPRGEACKEYVRETLAGMGWKTQEYLSYLTPDVPLYHDTVTQIKLDSWHRDNVVLLGDSAFCMTLLSGQGASLSLGGAYILAHELSKHPNNIQKAFQNYQAALEGQIKRRQKGAEGTARFLCPDSQFTIWIRNFFSRISFWPIIRHFSINQLGADSAIPKHILERC